MKLSSKQQVLTLVSKSLGTTDIILPNAAIQKHFLRWLKGVDKKQHTKLFIIYYYKIN